MGILKLKSQVSRLKKIAFGQDVYFPIQHHCKTISYGNHLNAWIIDPSLLSKDSIVYSFGIGNEIDFDLELIESFGCKVHAFDPTPKSLEWLKTQNTPESFIVHPVAISDSDGEITFYPPDENSGFSASMIQKDDTESRAYSVPAKTLGTLANELGHNKIDLLKMDIEGAEYNVVQDIIKSDIEIKQLLIEIHHRFEYLDVSMTKKMVEDLNKIGYKIFAISPLGQEYSFIKMS
jgi:FkbM family methyltransferase